MPLPIVHPTRKKWYYVQGNVKRNDIPENWNDFIKLNRRKFYLIDDFDKDFFDKLGKYWKEIGLEMTKYCTAQLQEEIKKRAYVEYVRSNFYGAWYERNLDFPKLFGAYIYLRNNRLELQVRFYYERLLMTDYDVDRDQPLPANRSLTGKDMRKEMPDILNTPVTIYKNIDYEDQIYTRKKKKEYKFRIGVRNSVVGKRQGRWYEAFDKWFRTEGYAYFKRLCEEHGLI